MRSGTKVTLLTGKHKGKKGYFVCWTTSHPLSSDKRAQIRLQTGEGWFTILVNKYNFLED